MVYQSTRSITLNASANIAPKRFVEAGANGLFAQVATAGHNAVGVSTGAVDTTKTPAFNCALLDGAVLEVEAGAAISLAAAAPVSSDNQGRAIPWVAGYVLLGYALTAASAAGEVVSITGERQYTPSA